MEKLNKILDWKLNKPNTDEQWANDVKKESLDVKFDYQLKEMEKTHQDKIPKVQEDLDKFDNWSDVVRYDLTKEFEQMFKDDPSIQRDTELHGNEEEDLRMIRRKIFRKQMEYVKSHD